MNDPSTKELHDEKQKETLEDFLRIDDVARLKIEATEKVMQEMPEGKNGLVIGSGKNTKDWIEAGWMTFDIDGSTEPTFVGDANRLSVIVGGNPLLDYVYCEDLTLSSETQDIDSMNVDGSKSTFPGVVYENLLREASTVLKPSGCLVIKSADLGEEFLVDENTTVINAERLGPMLVDNGFDPYLVPGNLEDLLDEEERKLGVRVTWYAFKQN